MRVEDGYKEQQQQQGVDDIGKGVVETVVEHEQHKAQDERRAYPYDLHTRTGGETEISVSPYV